MCADWYKIWFLQLNRPFPHSNKQWHRVEVGVDKNTVNVWKCPPEPRSGAIVRTHWSVMRERSIETQILHEMLMWAKRICNLIINVNKFPSFPHRISKRNRKPVFCVSSVLWKHSWKFGRTQKTCGNTHLLACHFSFSQTSTCASI